jgi:hypothetical protein
MEAAHISSLQILGRGQDVNTLVFVLAWGSFSLLSMQYTSFIKFLYAFRHPLQEGVRHHSRLRTPALSN